MRRWKRVAVTSEVWLNLFKDGFKERLVPEHPLPADAFVIRSYFDEANQRQWFILASDEWPPLKDGEVVPELHPTPTFHYARDE